MAEGPLTIGCTVTISPLLRSSKIARERERSAAHRTEGKAQIVKTCEENFRQRKEKQS
jgi:hypothetical protein